MSPAVAVVIVNYRTAGLVADCLRSLAPEREALAGLRVVVADNDSGDGSADVLARLVDEEGWGGWVEVMALPRNGGFAYGNNAGIRRLLALASPPAHIMLLNPDTLVQPGAVRALVERLEREPGAGIAGSQLLDREGRPTASSHHAPSPLGEFESAAEFGPLSRLLRSRAVTPPPREDPHRCDWVSGAALMVRRSVFEALGLLDDRYFLYFEEVDFCTRARAGGWEVWFEPASRVVHLEGAATGIGSARRRPAYWFDSRRRYFVTHCGVAGLLLADVLWALGRASLAVRRFLRLGRGGALPLPPHFAFDLLWGDARALGRAVPEFLRGRS